MLPPLALLPSLLPLRRRPPAPSIFLLLPPLLCNCSFHSALQTASTSDGASVVTVPQPEVPDEALADTFKRKGNVSRGYTGVVWGFNGVTAVHGCCSAACGSTASYDAGVVSGGAVRDGALPLEILARCDCLLNCTYPPVNLLCAGDVCCGAVRDGSQAVRAGAVALDQVRISAALHCPCIRRSW